MGIIRAVLAVVAAGLFGAGLATSASAAADADDATWLIAAHQGNLAEIAAGNAAVAQASNDEVRELGQMLIEDHTRLDAEVVRVAGELQVELPAQPTEMQRTDLEALKAIQNEEFDEAWVTAQIADHRATIAAAQEEAANGSDAAVTALAAEAVPVVQHHLEMLEVQNGEPDNLNGGDTGGSSSAPYIIGIIVVMLLVVAVAVLTSRRRSRRQGDQPE